MSSIVYALYHPIIKGHTIMDFHSALHCNNHSSLDDNALDHILHFWNSVRPIHIIIVMVIVIGIGLVFSSSEFGQLQGTSLAMCSGCQ